MANGQMMSKKAEAENRAIAQMLDEVGDLLAHQNASVFRVRAYHEGAAYIRTMETPLRRVFEDGGLRGLDTLPTIGPSIAAAIAEILETGTLGLIERLRGALDPETLFQSIPMIGPHLAHAIHNTLDIDSLEALEAAAHDGRLDTVNGIGPRRLRSIRQSIDAALSRRRRRHSTQSKLPPIADVLAVDRIYREKAARGELRMITPQRFNPTGSIQLPILHAERAEWRFTALFSNTPNAQRYAPRQDWVVIHVEHDGHQGGQCTVVTEQRGPLHGKRVIRGQEAACQRYYETHDLHSAQPSS